ncbi:MAG: hypothetical protein K8T10_21550 [Candidatus Eremiobacteraeota bacterium]|nr:hypothetical protein [Candidatus Eremiobacteraeota bacterium]
MSRKVNGFVIIGLLTMILLGLVCTGARSGTYPPGISYSSMLNGIKYFPRNGGFRLYHIQATFLPGPDTKGWVILSKKDGEKLYRYDFKVELLKAPYYLMDFYKAEDLKAGKKIASHNIKLTEPGKYTLDFHLDSGKFYTFDFSTSKLKSSDPFAGGDALFLDGPWSDWGYLYYRQASSDRNLVWKVWLRNKGIKKSQSAKVKLEIVRNKDGKRIATNRPRTTYTLQQTWNRFSFDLIHPMKGTGGGAIFKAKELLAKEGAYTLKMAVNGKHYGKWTFNVKGGKLQYAGRADRSKANPVTFIEGGRDAWWYKKK